MGVVGFTPAVGHVLPVNGATTYKGTPTYDTAAVTLFSAMSVQPSADRKLQINRLILSLQNAGVWSLLDVMYVLAAHDAQAARLNWKNPAAFALTPVNNPTFTVDQGYAGNGVSSYLDSGWAPSAGVQFTQNAGHVAIMLRTTGNTQGVLGRSTAGAPVLITTNQGGNVVVRINNGTSQTFATAATTGWFVATRATGATVEARVNGAQIGSAASVAAAPDSASLCLGRAGAGFQTAQMSAASFGGSIVAVDPTYYAALQVYMTAVGA